MFPLHLTAFEEYFFVDDRPDYPIIFQFHFKFDGSLDQNFIHRATENAIKRHPLLSCQILWKKNKPYWSPSSAEITPIEMDSTELRKVMGTKRIDLEKEPPIEVYHNSKELLFRVHHSALDGMGFLQFLADWRNEYQKASTESHPEDTKFGNAPPTKTLRKRCRPRLKFTEALQLLPGQWKTVRAVIKMSNYSMIPLIGTGSAKTQDRKPSSPEKPEIIRVVSQSLGQPETKQLLQRAKERKTTVNNLAILSFFQAMVTWKDLLGKENHGTHFRMMIPIDERRSNEPTMSACNHCTMINLDRTPKEISDSASLLAGIEQEMGVIKRWRLSLNFWRALEITRLLLGGLAAKSRPDQCQATCVLSNLGDMSRHPMLGSPNSNDNLNLKEMQILGPIRPGTNVILVIYSWKGRFRMDMRYDSTLISKLDAQKLLGLFADLLQEH